MASAAQKKMTIVCLMLLAVVGQIVADGDVTVEHPSRCTETVIDPRVPNNVCICSKNCACAGKCILESADDVQACFVNCVLKNDCVCSKIIPSSDPKANANANAK